MNIEGLVDRFKARVVWSPNIETFEFGSIDILNTNRRKKYPVLILKVPTSIANNFKFNTNEVIKQDYELSFHVFKKWTKTDKVTIDKQQIYREIEDIGNTYLRDVLSLGGNDYGLLDGNVTIDRGFFHQHGVDPVIGVSWKFKLRVNDC